MTDDESYNRAQMYGCVNMGDYHDLYLLADICLLADVFESYRDLALRIYNLDPAHYVSSPGLSWDAMLKFTGVELELNTDQVAFEFLESLRGGVSMASHHHSEANNKYMDDYDPDKESKYLMYLDANNLYGWAMSEPLPHKIKKH